MPTGAHLPKSCLSGVLRGTQLRPALGRKWLSLQRRRQFGSSRLVTWLVYFAETSTCMRAVFAAEATQGGATRSAGTGLAFGHFAVSAFPRCDFTRVAHIKGLVLRRAEHKERAGKLSLCSADDLCLPQIKPHPSLDLDIVGTVYQEVGCVVMLCIVWQGNQKGMRLILVGATDMAQIAGIVGFPARTEEGAEVGTETSFTKTCTVGWWMRWTWLSPTRKAAACARAIAPSFFTWRDHNWSAARFAWLGLPWEMDFPIRRPRCAHRRGTYCASDRTPLTEPSDGGLIGAFGLSDGPTVLALVFMWLALTVSAALRRTKQSAIADVCFAAVLTGARVAHRRCFFLGGIPAQHGAEARCSRRAKRIAASLTSRSNHSRIIRNAFCGSKRDILW